VGGVGEKKKRMRGSWVFPGVARPGRGLNWPADGAFGGKRVAESFSGATRSRTNGGQCPGHASSFWGRAASLLRERRSSRATEQAGRMYEQHCWAGAASFDVIRPKRACLASLIANTDRSACGHAPYRSTGSDPHRFALSNLTARSWTQGRRSPPQAPISVHRLSRTTSWTGGGGPSMDVAAMGVRCDLLFLSCDCPCGCRRVAAAPCQQGAGFKMGSIRRLKLTTPPRSRLNGRLTARRDLAHGTHQCYVLTRILSRPARLGREPMCALSRPRNAGGWGFWVHL